MAELTQVCQQPAARRSQHRPFKVERRLVRWAVSTLEAAKRNPLNSGSDPSAFPDTKLRR